MIFNVIAILLIFLYLFLRNLRNSKLALTSKGIERLSWFHFILGAFLLILWVCSKGNIYLPGYWSTKVLIWLFFISAVALYVLGSNELQSKKEKRYFSLFYFSPLIYSLSFFVVPYGAIALIPVIGNTFFGSEAAIYYSDSKYRIQEDHNSTYLVVKKGLYEIRNRTSRGVGGSAPDSTNIIELGGDSLIIQYYYKDWDKRNNPFPYEVKVSLNGMK